MKLSEYLLLQYVGWRGLMLGAFTAASKHQGGDPYYNTEEARMAGNLLTQAIHGVNMRRIDEAVGSGEAFEKLRQEARSKLAGLVRVMDVAVSDCKKSLADVAEVAVKAGEFNVSGVSSKLLFANTPKLDASDDIGAVRAAAEEYETALNKLYGVF